MEREISLVNGDKRVDLNKFTKGIVTSTILGMLQSLRGVDVEREIHIIISAAKRAGSAGRRA